MIKEKVNSTDCESYETLNGHNQIVLRFKASFTGVRESHKPRLPCKHLQVWTRNPLVITLSFFHLNVTAEDLKLLNPVLLSKDKTGSVILYINGSSNPLSIPKVL